MAHRDVAKAGMAAPWSAAHSEQHRQAANAARQRRVKASWWRRTRF